MAVQVDILCTHPMFGPDSGKGSWQGLNFMYECVRVGRSPERQQRVKNLLKVVSCSCACEKWDSSWLFNSETLGGKCSQHQEREGCMAFLKPGKAGIASKHNRI